MKYTLFLSILAAAALHGTAQTAQQYLLGAYEELTDAKPHDSEAMWSKINPATQFSWGNIDTRYQKLNVPDIKKTSSLQLKAWKGECINAQAVLWSKADLKDATIKVSSLRNGKHVIPSTDIKSHFVRYVMTDELNKDRKGGCGHRPNKQDWDSSLVADVLDIINIRDIKACTAQPIWLTVNVPATTKTGKYNGTVTVSGKGMKDLSLQLEVEVVSQTLPAPKDWTFHLDLWQNPYAVARYYQVPLWSKEHFDAMRPIMKMLADAGQRVVTATIMDKPWNGQTEDPYDSMVGKSRSIDGKWSYDYTVFDHWVTFMMDEVGIDKGINCYTMIPWALSFDYYDQASNKIQYVKAKPGEKAYSDYWGTFLKDFARHLREKGWFDKTAISMDERSMEDMQQAIKVIKDADPNFKITLAGNFHPEIEPDLYYLSIPFGHQFPDDVKARREKNRQISTVYTCCSEAFPSTFTFSDPAEAAWTPLHALAAGYDGYLRWAVNSWTADPLRDSRFRSFAAGDTYSIYPGPRSSIRFQRFVQGLQLCEKINIMRQQLTKSGDKRSLKKLNDTVAKFTINGLADTQQSPEQMVTELTNLLNSLQLKK